MWVHAANRLGNSQGYFLENRGYAKTANPKTKIQRRTLGDDRPGRVQLRGNLRLSEPAMLSIW